MNALDYFFFNQKIHEARDPQTIRQIRDEIESLPESQEKASLQRTLVDRIVRITSKPK